MRAPRFSHASDSFALLFLFLFALVPSALAQQPPAAVRVDAVRTEVVADHRTVTGSLRAAQRANIAAREKGIVLALNARPGDHIEKGFEIAQLDSTQLELDLLVLDAGRLPFESALVERRSELERAERDFAAVESLNEKNAASRKELDDARSTVTEARARLEAGEAQLKLKGAVIAKLKRRIEDMSVLAPFDGTVVRRMTEVGAWVGEGAALVELVSSERLEIWLEVPQGLFSALSVPVGPIAFRVGRGEQSFVLDEYVLVPEVEKRGRAFALIGRINDNPALAPGMSVVADVPTGARSEQLTIHRDAILRNAVGSFVYAVIPGAKDQPASAAPIDVRVLFQTKERAVVEAPGLKPGMEIVIEGNERLYPMAPVQPRRAGEKPAERSGK